jgi:hypothetical protein
MPLGSQAADVAMGSSALLRIIVNLQRWHPRGDSRGLK